LLESNTTEVREEPAANEEKKWVDGGKLPPKTQKEILTMINQKYNFPNFNILLYA
jgi:hypothetical protein